MGNHKRLLVAVVICTCLGGLTGCTKTATGSPEWISKEASKSVDKSDTVGLLLKPTEVGDVVGADLNDVFDKDAPFDDSVVEQCEVLGGLGLASLAGDNWDAFHFRKLDDEPSEDANANNYVAEVAIVYSDADAAKASFETTSKMAKDCDGSARESSGYSWKSKIEDSTDHSFTWTDEQTDLSPGDEWRCAGDSRLRNNVVLRVLTCSGSDDQPAHTAKIADEISTRVWDVSAPGK